MIHGYEKRNNVLDILKSIANLRNKHIVANAYKSPHWKSNIRELRKKIDVNNKGKFKNDQIETAFINLLKKYKYDWDGMWSIIDTKNGNINNISVFDPDDYEFFLSHLNVFYYSFY